MVRASHKGTVESVYVPRTHVMTAVAAMTPAVVMTAVNLRILVRLQTGQDARPAMRRSRTSAHHWSQASEAAVS